MRFEGTLSKWNDERGFGFIAPAQGGPEVFVHISVFPKDGSRPKVGENVTFEIETDERGKKCAKNFFCPDRPIVVPSSHSLRQTRYVRQTRYNHKENPHFFIQIIFVLFFIGLGTYGIGEYSRRTNDVSLPVIADKTASITSPRYRCDGRRHCSEMTSCSEATFFLENCENTVMDGDHDGVPCEEQWCSR